MRAVRIETLKDRLEELLSLVAGGETVMLIDGDRVVAELRPPQASPAMNLAEAVRRGLLTPATQISQEPPPRLFVAPLKVVLEELERDREDR